MFSWLLNKKCEADIQTKILIYQTKANLDLKILFGKITRFLGPEIYTSLFLLGHKLCCVVAVALFNTTFLCSKHLCSFS